MREPRGFAGQLEGELLPVLENIGKGLTVIDEAGRFVFVNHEAARLLGFPSAEALLATPSSEIAQRFELLDDEGRALPAELLPTRTAREGQATPWTVVGFRERGTSEERWALLRASPVLDAQKQVKRVITLWHDITVERREELAARFLAKASSRLASAITDYDATLTEVANLAVPSFADWCAVDLAEGDALRRVAVAHVDPSKIRFVTEIEAKYPAAMDETNAALRVVRTGKSELFPEIPAELIEQGARNAEHRELIRALNLHSAIVAPLTARGRTLGAITFVWAESPRRYGTVDLELAEDLGRRAGMAVDNARLFEEVRTLSATLEKRVDERTAALQEANRELESFSYSVSHDLRAPLRHVAGFVELLDKHARSKLDERSVHYLDTIRDAAKRAGELVDALLAFSRMGRAPLKPGQVDLARVVAEVRAELEPELAGRTVSWQVGPLPTVAADPALMRVVMHNLVGNAVKFTARVPEARIELSARDGAGETELTVRDNGAGFDPRYVDKLFGVFQRLHTAEDFEGTGIGLATVRRIIAKHGGRIWAEGQPGQGAAFHFTLPHAPAEEKP